MSDANMTPKKFATDFGYDPKSVRRVMRSMTESDAQPGSGGRWEMDDDFVAALKLRMEKSHNKKVTVATVKSLKK